MNKGRSQLELYVSYLCLSFELTLPSRTGDPESDTSKRSYRLILIMDQSVFYLPQDPVVKSFPSYLSRMAVDD